MEDQYIFVCMPQNKATWDFKVSVEVCVYTVEYLWQHCGKGPG